MKCPVSDAITADPAGRRRSYGPAYRVAQIYSAGHSRYEMYILDTHDHPVIAPVWQHYERAIERCGWSLYDRGRRVLYCANSKLNAFERLEIYNRQYWFRVLGARAETFPRVSARPCAQPHVSGEYGRAHALAIGRGAHTRKRMGGFAPAMAFSTM